jgi:hypothetical protein
VTSVSGWIAFLLIFAALSLESFGLHLLPFEDVVKISLGLIAGYFIFHSVVTATERVELIEKTTNIIEGLTRSIGVLRIIGHSEEYYRELKAAMDAATDCVFLFYLTDQPPPQLGSVSQAYWNWFNEFALERGDSLTIKRVASISNAAKARWLLAQTLAMKDVRGYGIRCFLPGTTLSIPGIEVIDRKETFFFGPHGRTPRWVYIDNEDIGSGMASYFDRVWDEVLTIGGFELKAVGELGLNPAGLEKLRALTVEGAEVTEIVVALPPE